MPAPRPPPGPASEPPRHGPRAAPAPAGTSAGPQPARRRPDNAAPPGGEPIPGEGEGGEGWPIPGEGGTAGPAPPRGSASASARTQAVLGFASAQRARARSGLTRSPSTPRGQLGPWRGSPPGLERPSGGGGGSGGVGRTRFRGRRRGAGLRLARGHIATGGRGWLGPGSRPVPRGFQPGGGRPAAPRPSFRGEFRAGRGRRAGGGLGRGPAAYKTGRAAAGATRCCAFVPVTMSPVCLFALLLSLVGAPAAAESIRETEVIDPQDLRLEGRYFSGALPDDEDVGGPGQEPDDFELSGSGDLDDSEDTRISPDVIHPLVPIKNHIPERAGPVNQDPSQPKELDENEVIPKRISPSDGNEDVSNKVSMSSTAQGGSIFERAEVLAALIVGGVVAILFATFLVLLLVHRMKKKDEGSYDLGKKPIYKKAPTNEFYA
ncbi:syndecan-4 [Tenrec ecaudatus]|uniref:syndecan-4 n=1 Tax=Tenrec ecaudatus TaxID=94439 RepID=UPI003F599CA3